MIDFFKNNIFSISTFVLALISVCTVVILIIHNNNYLKVIKRPYIAMSCVTINSGISQSGFVIKNYGKTSATITSFDFDKSLLSENVPHEYYNSQFDKLVNLTLVPGQSKHLLYSSTNIKREPMIINITYASGKNVYTDVFTLYPISENQILHVRSVNKDNPLSSIAYSIQDLRDRFI